MKNNDDFFGTMFDFNGDGHTDITETYMAYRMMNDDDDSFTPRRAPSGSSSGSGLTAVVVIIVILLIIGWFFGGCSRQANSKLSSPYSYSSSKTHSSSYSYQRETESSAVQPTTKKSTYILFLKIKVE